jgi:hypothetical protein
MIKRTLILLIAVAGFCNAEPVYGPFVATWKDSLHHELGTQQARHMTEAGKQWMIDAQARGYSEAECVGRLRDAFYAHHNTLPALPEPRQTVTAMPDAVVTDPAPGDAISSDKSKPDFHHLFGDVKLAHAIKNKLNDPGSYQTISVGEPFSDTFNGFPCWTVNVNFFARNVFNAVMRNSARVSVMMMGGNWEVVNCEIQS